jgi:hypothetical protein
MLGAGSRQEEIKGWLNAEDAKYAEKGNNLGKALFL